MSVRKGYNRYFIIFQEEDKGYGIAIDKQPTGYAKIEVRNGKCKVTVYAQNIKKEKGPYNFCMIDMTKTPAGMIKLGEVRIDEIGTGETFWEYNEDNVCNSGQSIDKYNVAVLMADEEKLLAPLMGCNSKERVLWKDKLSVQDSIDNLDLTRNAEMSHEAEISERDKDEFDDEARKFMDYEATIKVEADILRDEVENDQNEQEDDVLMRHKGKMKGHKKEECDKCKYKHEHEQYDINDCNDNHNYSGSHDHISNSEDHLGALYNEYQQEKCNHPKKQHKSKSYADVFHHLLEEFEEVTEDLTENKINKVRWWKIPSKYDAKMIDERHYPFMCTIFHLSMAYPNIDYFKYFHQTGHYYFGIKYDEDNEVKYLMYGVSGRHDIKDQPYMGMTGFGKWVKTKGDLGLWIMFYNPKTGNFMIEKSK